MATRLAGRRRFQRFAAFDFSGGLDVTTAPVLLATKYPNRLISAGNVLYNIDGSLTSRGGMGRVTDFGGSTGAIQGGTYFELSTGTRYIVVAAVNGVYTYNMDTAATAKIDGAPAFTTSTSQFAHFAALNDTLYMANGDDAPCKWDGTTFAAIGASSPAKMDVVVTHGSRLFATSTAAPSRVYYSKLNNGNDWSGTDDAGFIDVNPNDGSTVHELVSSNQELIILKGSRPYRLQGIGPITGYTIADSLTPATGSIGTKSAQGGVFAGNTVWYASDVGFHSLATTDQFGDLLEQYASRRIQRLFQTSTYGSTDPIDHAGSLARVVYDPSFDAIYSRFRFFGSTPFGLLRYYLGLNAWSIWSTDAAHSASIKTIWIAPNPDANHVQPALWMAGDFGDNAAYVMSPSVGSFLSTQDYGISSERTTVLASASHVSSLGAIGIQKEPRFLYLYVTAASGTLNVALTYDIDVGGYSTTVSATPSGIIRVDLPSALCEFLTVTVSNASSNTVPWTWSGYEVFWRARRELRRTIS